MQFINDIYIYHVYYVILNMMHIWITKFIEKILYESFILSVIKIGSISLQMYNDEQWWIKEDTCNSNTNIYKLPTCT